MWDAHRVVARADRRQGGEASMACATSALGSNGDGRSNGEGCARFGRRRLAELVAGAAVMASTRDARATSSDGATADAGDLEARELLIDGAGARHRMMLFVPRHLARGGGAVAPEDRVPLLVLLHGLGETIDEQLGAHAWSDRYGLVRAYERLRRPPIARTATRADWTDARLAEVNAGLAARPFRGFVIACPFLPNVAAAGAGALDAYARWLVEAAIPRARLEGAPWLVDGTGPGAPDAGPTTRIGGCSLGGYASLEIFLRYPELFRAWGGVQTAIAEASAASYAARLARAIARVGPRDLHLESSLADPFRKANVALAAALASRGIACELRVLPGPHDQPWLREAGTVESLFWHDAHR
jgi:hypothetical protein